MARQYRRDARGRFASGGSTGRRAGGTLAARASLRSSRKKLAAKDPADGSLKGTLSRRAQKGAVTKGSKKLREAKKASTVRIAGRRGGTVGRPKGYVRPAAAKQGRTASTSAPSRARITGTTRPSSTIRKPRGFEVGSLTSRIMEKDRATIKVTTERIERAERRNKQLRTAQSQIDYRRANPVGGKAARGQATKRLNKQQRKLDKSRSKVFGAVESIYKPQREAAYSRLAAITRARQSVTGLRQGRKGSMLQRNIFGGATASYL